VQNAIAVAKVRPTSVRFDALERLNVIAAFFGSLMSTKVVHVLSEGNAPSAFAILRCGSFGHAIDLSFGFEPISTSRPSSRPRASYNS
jgi:hypothetical protein